MTTSSRRFLPFLAAAALGLAGCQTFPTDRISAHQAEYNSWPPNVQAEVRQGLVDVGFTERQVWMALGDPQTKTEAGPPGDVTEVWVYHRRAPRFGFGFGGASFGDHSAVAGGVSVNGLKLGQDVDGQVVFTNGRVTSLQVYTR
ncbi:MAG TPA: hypothetical protein VFE31_05500 [Opitutaceae bacterium]|jgi:hypothetical protein|nr:hypothetical protein [Opitutaceae bacterium]